MKITHVPAGIDRDRGLARDTNRRIVDYVPPPRDKTPVDARVTRRCWVALSSDDAPVDVPAGTVIRLPRWLADELVVNGKASLLPDKVVRLPG